MLIYHFSEFNRIDSLYHVKNRYDILHFVLLDVAEKMPCSPLAYLFDNLPGLLKVVFPDKGYAAFDSLKYLLGIAGLGRCDDPDTLRDCGKYLEYILPDSVHGFVIRKRAGVFQYTIWICQEFYFFPDLDCSIRCGKRV